MLTIKVCATSANVCVGFDVLGLALDLANFYQFEEAKEFSFIGFDQAFQNLENNLVYQAYIRAFEYAQQEPIPVCISIQTNIPVSRGLGSSASLIVAGLFAANYYLNNRFSKEELLQLATQMEGHPDNVAAAIYGGLVASYYDDHYHSICYPVHTDLHFIAVIPPYQVATSEARKILPKQVSYHDAVHNLSRIIHLPKAFAEGDIHLLKALFSDHLHEPYRKRLIKEYQEVYELCKEEEAALAISGSGSTMLIICKDVSLQEKLEKLNCTIQILKIGKGVDVWKN